MATSGELERTTSNSNRVVNCNVSRAISVSRPSQSRSSCRSALHQPSLSAVSSRAPSVGEKGTHPDGFLPARPARGVAKAGPIEVLSNRSDPRCHDALIHRSSWLVSKRGLSAARRPTAVLAPQSHQRVLREVDPDGSVERSLKKSPDQLRPVCSCEMPKSPSRY